MSTAVRWLCHRSCENRQEKAGASLGRGESAQSEMEVVAAQMTAACEATGSGQGGGRRRRWWWTRREREAECVPWASHLQMLQRRLLRARGEYAWRRPRARLLACGSGQLGQAVQEGQAQWKGGADEHRDLRPRHRAHAPRYCPCPRRRTSGGSESSLTLSFGSPQYPLVVTSTRPLVRAASERPW